jgi:transposase InsO family protein
LFGLFIERGVPEYIRTDNGSEFTAIAVREWLSNVGVKALYIEPESPRENGYNESCIDLLYWGIIEYCYKRGIRCIEMGRSLQRSSQSKFKLKWGAQPSSIYYNYVTGNKGTRFNMYYEGNFYKTATSIRRHLPLCITKNVGYLFLPYL